MSFTRTLTIEQAKWSSKTQPASQRVSTTVLIFARVLHFSGILLNPVIYDAWIEGLSSVVLAHSSSLIHMYNSCDNDGIIVSGTKSSNIAHDFSCVIFQAAGYNVTLSKVSSGRKNVIRICVHVSARPSSLRDLKASREFISRKFRPRFGNIGGGHLGKVDQTRVTTNDSLSYGAHVNRYLAAVLERTFWYLN